MDQNEKFEQDAQESFKYAMERLSDVMEPEYTCNECKEEFYSSDYSPECPECFSSDVERESEETREDFEQAVLAFDKHITYEVTMSTGGPASGYTLYCDDDGYITRADYWFQDWYQPKRRFALTGDKLDNVKSMFECWTEGQAHV